MEHLLTAPRLNSCLASFIFTRLLRSERMTIVLGSVSLESEVDHIVMEHYSTEGLVHEYERRYGKISWFHEHAASQGALEEEVAAFLRHVPYGQLPSEILDLLTRIVDNAPLSSIEKSVEECAKKFSPKEEVPCTQEFLPMSSVVMCS